MRGRGVTMNIAFTRTCMTCVALAVSIAGCSGGSSPGAASASSPVSSPSSASTPSMTMAPTAGGLDAAFKARANAACKPFADWNDGHPFPFPGFSPSHPDPKVLPKVGAFFDTSPGNHTFTTALRALGEPAAGSKAWSAWLHQLDVTIALDHAQITDAKRADAAAFAANVNQVLAQTPALDAALSPLGFSPSDPCSRVL